MRVMPYWSTGALTISQDKPADTAYLFTLANVTKEGLAIKALAAKRAQRFALLATSISTAAILPTKQ
jgi:predicted phage tail protein